MNLQEMVRHLLDNGYSQGALAREVGVGQPTIFRALNGADVRFSTGQKIEQIYLGRREDEGITGAERPNP